MRDLDDLTGPPRPDGPDRSFGSVTLQPGGSIDRSPAVDPPAAMSLRGTALRALVLFEVALVSGWFTWTKHDAGGSVVPWLLLGSVVGLALGLVIAGRPAMARSLAGPYAVAQGLALGSLSASLEAVAPGIVGTAIVATVLVSAAVLLVSLLLPRALSKGFATGVTIATVAIVGIYAIDLIASAFGAPVVFLHQSGWLAIVISIVVIVVACANLLLDIDFIRAQSARGAPRELEWFAAWSLLLSVLWIYVEIARVVLESIVFGEGDGD